MKPQKDIEEQKRKLEEDIEEMKRTIMGQPGGIWAVIVGLVMSLLCSLLCLAGILYGFVGFTLISVLAWLTGTGRINEPVVATITSVAFASFPIFLILFSLFWAIILGISSIILFFL